MELCLLIHNSEKHKPYIVLCSITSIPKTKYWVDADTNDEFQYLRQLL